MHKMLSTTHAPGALGPYSQAILHQNTLFISGQIGIDPKTGAIPSDFPAQAEQIMKNLTSILAEADFTLEHVVKTTIFLADLAHFAAMNEIYGKYFTESKPARSCVQVAGLPKGALAEIELIAIK
jgi:2-iminobutanoate/2-iminopropanoate deaminase